MKEDYGFILKYWIFCIAVVIICINIGCRVNDAIKSKEYERTEGTVVSLRSEKKTISQKGYYAGRYHFYEEGTSRYATIEFETDDSDHGEHFEVEFGNRYFREGDTIPVMYKSEGRSVSEYPAKRDWITGAWLDARKDYNTPLIIASLIILAGVGYLYLIGVLKPRFKNSRKVITAAGMLSGVILIVLCRNIYVAGGEMADEGFTGFIVGIMLALFSLALAIKMCDIRRKAKDKG